MTQPGFAQALQNFNWQTGICDCFSDIRVCIYGTFCFMCLGCQASADMNECCLCRTKVAMRTLYRTRYGIPGSIFENYMVTACGSVRRLCQIKKAIRRSRAIDAF